MDDNEFMKKLQNLDAPEPSKDAQNQALDRAMAAYDRKMKINPQGKAETGRLTDIINQVRRTVMKKRYVMSGMAGSVAVCALVAVLGMPFYETEISRIAGVQKSAVENDGAKALAKALQAARERDKKKPEVHSDFTSVSDNVATAPGALGNIVNSVTGVFSKEGAPSVPATSVVQPLDPEYQRAIEEENPKLAEFGTRLKAIEAESQTRSEQAMRSQGSAMPTPTGSRDTSKDPLADWRSRSEAERLVMPGDIQPHMPDQGRDKFESSQENAVKQVAAEPVSTFSIDVDTSSYSFIRKSLNNGALPPKDAVRIEEMVNYFDYDYPTPDAGADPFRPTVAVYDSPWKADAKVVHIGIKGFEMVGEKPKSNLVFLIDTSGSMNQPDKLPLLKSSFKMMLDSLNPDDTVGIVVYAGSAGTLLEPTKVSDKRKIIDAIDSLGAGGGTAGAAGIKAAYDLAKASFIKGGNNRIILATDGDFNVGVSNPEELKAYVSEKRADGVFLSVLGFGQGNYNDHMMQALAQNGNGNAAYIDTLSEARKVLVEEAGSTLFTIAKDVKIQVEFNPALVAEYRLVGYETRRLNREDFNNDKVDAGDVGAGHAVTAIYEITPVGATPSVDALRYEKKEEGFVPAKPAGSEYAFLKIRYKKPGSDTSILMTRPIVKEDEKEFANLSSDIRFAAAVASFGQLLKGGQYAGGITYDDVIKVASDAKGEDPFGYRGEFVNLVRLAKTMK